MRPKLSAEVDDNFVIPATQTWQITEVDIRGIFSDLFNPPSSFDVHFHTDASSCPAQTCT